MEIWGEVRVHEFIEKLDTKLMLGVGAAFDIHTGQLEDSPAWIKRAGLQWLHRLCQEPRRLGKRYLVNNPDFVLSISLQLLGLRSYTIPQPKPGCGLASRAA
jgi:N-acetylglucosaminyldiphosphoundecaprenol N-acetyl-beta-D-mannosaminyltransferase